MGLGDVVGTISKIAKTFLGDNPVVKVIDVAQTIYAAYEAKDYTKIAQVMKDFDWEGYWESQGTTQLRQTGSAPSMAARMLSTIMTTAMADTSTPSEYANQWKKAVANIKDFPASDTPRGYPYDVPYDNSQEPEWKVGPQVDQYGTRDSSGGDKLPPPQKGGLGGFLSNILKNIPETAWPGIVEAITGMFEPDEEPGDLTGHKQWYGVDPQGNHVVYDTMRAADKSGGDVRRKRTVLSEGGFKQGGFPEPWKTRTKYG